MGSSSMVPRRMVLTAVVAFLMSACGGDSMGPGPGNGGDPGFMVGEWIATVMVVTSVANPEVFTDVIAEGGTFTLSVQPSGRYTAILSGLGQSSSESGTLAVEGNEVVFRRELPSPQTSRATFERQGANVTLRGPTQFDFNFDGEPEAGNLVLTLTPR